MTVAGTGTAGVRLGVSGHRAHESRVQAVAALVDEVLDGLAAPGRVLSSLAEGADRVVAERALARPGWDLAVVLPLDPTDYEADFAEPSSREAFRALLADAAVVDRVPHETTREGAYLAAGLAVLDGSDALLAIWDGEPARGRGGTSEVVAEARRRDLPVAWVRVDRDDPDDPTDDADPPVEPTLTLERWTWAS